MNAQAFRRDVLTPAVDLIVNQHRSLNVCRECGRTSLPGEVIWHESGCGRPDSRVETWRRQAWSVDLKEHAALMAEEGTLP